MELLIAIRQLKKRPFSIEKLHAMVGLREYMAEQINALKSEISNLKYRGDE